METGGVRRLNRSSPSCLNTPAQRTDFFHGLQGSVPKRRANIPGAEGTTEASGRRDQAGLASRKRGVGAVRGAVPAQNELKSDRPRAKTPMNRRKSRPRRRAAPIEYWGRSCALRVRELAVSRSWHEKCRSLDAFDCCARRKGWHIDFENVSGTEVAATD